MAGPGASARHHHNSSHRLLGTAAGAMWLVATNTARAFLVRLPLSFGPPIARPYHATVRWATTSAPASAPTTSSPSPSTPVKLPGAVSPSSLGDFKTCPRLYRFRHVERVPEPASEMMVRGSMVHDALDQLFMQPPANRTEAVLHDLFRAVWLKRKDKYLEELFPTVDRQRAFGLAGLKLLSNYYQVERPEAVEPLMREHRMRVPLEGGPNVTGILDRVDEEGQELVVVDYKTGKAPSLRYSDSVNQRIMSDKFFQLKIYALLLLETTGRLPSKLKLIYLDGPTIMTMKLLPEDVDDARRELTALWDQICAAAQQDAFPTKPGKICEWCSFKSICPAWNFPSPQQAAVVGAVREKAGRVVGPEAEITVVVESAGSGKSGGKGIKMVVRDGLSSSGVSEENDSDDGEDGAPPSGQRGNGRGRKAAAPVAGGGAEGAAVSPPSPAAAANKKAAAGTRKRRAAGATSSSGSTTGASADNITAAETGTRRRGRKPKEVVAVGAEQQQEEEDQQRQQQQQMDSLAVAKAAAAFLSTSDWGKVVQAAAAEGRT